jgi:integrase
MRRDFVVFGSERTSLSPTSSGGGAAGGQPKLVPAETKQRDTSDLGFQDRCAADGRGEHSFDSEDLPKVRRSPAGALTGAEANALLNAATGTPWRAFFLLALCIAARRGELAGLRWASIDFERAAATIAEGLCANRTGVYVKSTKTDAVRTVPLSRVALAALKGLRVEQAAERLRDGPAYDNRPFVFADALGRPWNPRSISNGFAAIAAKAGLRGVRLHDLRHTAATWLLRSGVDVRTVAEVLGHAKATTTLGTYAHVMPGTGTRAVEAMAERLGPSGP